MAKEERSVFLVFFVCFCTDFSKVDCILKKNKYKDMGFIQSFFREKKIKLDFQAST